jgi:succinate dehydrogenase/fumarate reductase iron-sulfur protein
MADTVNITLFRYNPSTDAEPRYVDYEVPYFVDEADPKGPMSLLFALEWIYENVEPIAFDHNCDTGICGRCSMLVGGIPKLACWTKLEKGGSYTIEPLRGAPVIRDLVVDKSSYYNRFVNTNVEVQSKVPINKLVNIDYNLWYNTLDKINRCRECACCYSICPVMNSGATERYVGPGAMMQIAMRHLDPNDEADRVWQAVFSGVYECAQCGYCSSVCPSTISIKENIKMLQDAADAAGFTAESTSTIPPSIAAAGYKN